MADFTRNAEAARRAIDTLLRNARARSVMLRIPAPAIAGDITEQLGLTTPQFQDVELNPAVFRTASTQVTKAGAMERDLFVSATTVQALTGSQNFASANALFATAFGILIDETLTEILSVSEIEAGGQVCGYRLLLREAHIST